MIAARSLAHGELWVLGSGFALASGIALAVEGWNIFGDVAALRGRLLHAVLALAPLFAAHEVLRRAKKHPWYETAHLAWPTLLFALVIKVEALAFGKNLLVAVLWSMGALVYLELGRRLAARSWLALGHTLLAAALVHLLAVNFVQPGDVVLSLRLVTVLPVLGVTAYAYLTWDHTHSPVGALPPRLARARAAYLYIAISLFATLILYEVHRAWVVVGWSALAAGCLLAHRRGGTVHLRIAATLLGVAVLARALAANLYYRDFVGELRLNLVAIPMSVALLFCGWALARGAPEHGLKGRRRWLAGHRLGWLFGATLVTTAFVWVELAGPMFTVALSLEGLALIVLGFFARERPARLAALGLLVFCVTKLFFWDLRGLEGLARVTSFVVLGLVLIAVSYAYTRFRERLKSIL
jgi:hypothetical protein